MRARRDRNRPTSLNLTRLEDRSVPAGLDALTPPAFNPDGDVGLNTHPLSHFLGGTDFLTGPQAGDPAVLARQALATFAPNLGLTAADVAGAIATNGYADVGGSGLYHAYFRQSYNGLEVFNTSVGVHVMPDGRVLTVNGGFVPGIAATGALAAPAVTPTAAVAAAAAYFGITLTDPPQQISADGTVDRRTVVSEPEASRSPITARLVYVNTPLGAREAWQFNLDVPDGSHWLDVAVDAETGQVTFYADWIENYSATYTALPTATIDPTTGPRRTTVNPYDPVASPFGWQDTNGVAGAEFTDTRGNNVFAQADLNDISSDPFTGQENGMIAGTRPDAGPGLVFNYPLNLSADPTNSIDASVTQLYYLVNVLHDVHYKYGFNEAAGNFQVSNYSNQGLGGDQVYADVLDGDSIGKPFNPSFATPPEQANLLYPNPRMEMYANGDFLIAPGSFSPRRDAAFASQITVHEYGHGVSNRLTGGPANANALDTYQSAGMGEGWSDYWALMFTQQPTSTKNGLNPQGTWILGQPANGPGIRRYPYSFDMSVNPLTFGDYNTDTSGPSLPTGLPPFGFPETHNTGEIWTSTLWDMSWLLIDKYGFDGDLSTGYSPGNGPAGAGNKLSLQLVMDGLKLQPANPTFIEARDAILAADLALTGGQNRREIWTAFARRGLGVNASTGNSSDTAVGLSFAVPASLNNPAVIGQTPSARVQGGAAPSSVTFTFSEPMNQLSFSAVSDVVSFTGPGGVDLRPTIFNATWNATSTQLTLDFAYTPAAGFSAQGAYQLRLSPDIRSADNGSQLDQNIDGVAGGAADFYTANFRYDAAVLKATLTSTPSAADPNLPGAVIALFSEPVNPASVGVANLQVSQGTVTGFTILTTTPVMVNGVTVNAATSVRYDLAGVTGAPVYVSILYGAVTDPYGFPIEESNAKFGKTVIPAVPFPTPLNSYGPLGWEAYDGAVVGYVGFSEVDSYFLDLDAGQILSVTADNLAMSLRAQLKLFDPDGNPIALATSTADGATVSVGPVVSPTAGRYVMQVSQISNSTGSYRLRVLVAASVEVETQDPTTTNDSPFSAEGLGTLLLTQGGAGSTLRGATIAGNVGKADPNFFFFGDTDDYYTFDARANQQFTVGLFRTAGGSALTLTVTSPTGTTLAASPNPTNFDRAVTFTPATNGTYTIRVSIAGFGGLTTNGTNYALGVVTNGAMDLEGNDTAATAKPVALNGNVRGGITAGGDEDWYQITVPAGPSVTVYFTTLTPGDGPNQPDNFLDPTIEIYSSGGTLSVAGGLATDNAAADQKNSLVRADLSPGVYQLRVRASTLTLAPTVGEYVVQLSTASNPGPVNPSIGGTNTVTEGGVLILQGLATDPNGDGLTYDWDLNGDGAFGDLVTSSATFPIDWASLVALGITDGPATFPIQLRVSDGVNPPVLAIPATLTVLNGNPAGTLAFGSGTGVVNEGDSTQTVQLTGATDPSALDIVAGLHYSFDLNADGTIDALDAALGGGDGTYAGSAGVPATIAVPAATFADGSAAGVPVTIVGRVIDKDGGFQNTSVTFTVLNVRPTATGVSGTLSEGVPGTIRVDNPTDASNFGPTTDQPTLHFSFDLNGDGLFNDGFGDGTYLGSPNTTGTLTVPANLIPDGPAIKTVGARVIDKDGGFTDFLNVALTVSNAPPAGVFTNRGPVGEGSTVTVEFASNNVTDPSGADTLAGFSYAYDFNDDGVYDNVAFNPMAPTYATAQAGAFTATVDASYLSDGNDPASLTPTTRRVRVRVFDKDGGVAEYTTDVRINNVAPTASMSGASVTVGTPLSVTITSQSDPSSVDTTAGFKYSFDFNNDGDFADVGDVFNATSPAASFTYLTPGTKTVHGRIADKDGGFTDFYQTFAVDNVAPTATVSFPGVPVVAGLPTLTEGGTTNVTVSALHPSSATTNAGFRYAYDFDGDGTFDFPLGATGYANASALATVPVPAALTADGTRPLSVRVRVYEVNGLSTDVVAPLQVLGVAPTATFAGPTATVEVSDKVTFTFTGAADPSPADTTAGFRYSIDLNNDGDFADPGEVVDAASATVTTSFNTSGTKTVRGRVTDKDGQFTDYFLNATVRSKVKTGFVTGVDAGNAPNVQLYNADGSLKFQTLAFDPSVTGGVRVASADVNGDGVPDIIVGTGPGSIAEIRVLDGSNGRLLFSARPFENTFTGGVFVAAGDMDGDGRAEFAVSPDQGGGARVLVYRGLSFLQTISFFGINDPAFRGGARISMADMNGDGRADLLVAAGFMGGPRVAGFEGSGLLFGRQTKLFADFFAFEKELRNGVYLAGGDVNGDGIADLVVGAGPDGGPRVTVYDGASLIAGKPAVMASFFAGNDSRRGGVRVAVADVDGDGLVDVLTGEADGPRLDLFFGKNIRTGQAGDATEFFPFSTPLNGVFVG